MGADLKDLQALHVIDSVTDVCLKETVCGVCERENCLVGYAQECIRKCLNNNVTFVEDGVKNIPLHDMRIYNEDRLVNGIADILLSCRSCKFEHFENCVVNVIRNCYEIALFGDIQPYEGSNFRYLAALNMNGMKDAQQILDTFHKKKAKLEAQATE